MSSAETRSIPFTEYVLPHGERRLTSISRPAEIEERARRIIAAGYSFEVEKLTTGEISMTITHPRDGDVAFEICRNEPGEPAAAVDKLILGFRLRGEA